MVCLVSLLVGVIVGYLLAVSRRSSRSQSLLEETGRAKQQAERVPGLESKLEELTLANTQLQTQMASLSKQLEASGEKTQWLETAEQQLREAFEALASNALKSNSEDFTSRTRQQIVEPLQKKLDALDGQVRELEQKREGAYKSIDEHLGNLKSAYEQLRNTTSGLTTALTTSSGVRGEWGEIQMRRVVELAGMVRHVDFDEQETTDAGKPDMLVHLPNEGILPIDAKTTMKTYLEAMDAPDDRVRKVKMAAHAAAVRSRVRDLAGKEYWKQFERSPDFVVMFIPNEACFSGAFEGDRDLLDYALSQRVLITTPVTLLALLKTVAYGWQQQSMAENAREIATQARELVDRLAKFFEHLHRTGKSLNSTVDAFNASVGSLNSRVMPSARRLKDMGVGAQDIEDLSAIEKRAALPPPKPE